MIGLSARLALNSGGHNHKSDAAHLNQVSFTLATATVGRYSLNALRGADNFLLDSAKQIRFNPHEDVEFLKSLKLGDTVKVPGITSKTTDLLFISAVTYENGIVI